MNDEVKARMEDEQVFLFKQLWAQLEEEQAELEKDVNTASGLACSRLDLTSGPLNSLVEIYPDRMDLLNRNRAEVTELISRKKYFLLKAFKDILKTCHAYMTEDQQAVYAHWEEELAKDEPNLIDRFERYKGEVSA